MYSVCKEIHFCYGHRLLNYNGPCQHPHGHNGRAEIHVASDTLDRADMVIDFGEIKDKIKGWIDDTLDHRMLLHRDDPLVKPLQELGEPVVVFDRNPTAEEIARRIFVYAKECGLKVTEVRVWETESSYAAYRG